MAGNSSGYILITAVLLVLLLTGLLLGLHMEAAAQWMLARNVGGQLYSLVLAENGVECARALLPHVDLNELLAGQDGRFSGTARPQWRNPVTFEEARTLCPETWTPAVDDGLPFPDGALVSGRYLAPGGGSFFLRFSNNPEEPPERDSDQIVIVRSLGLVPAGLRDLSPGSAINDVTLIEARFRQELSFLLPSPLTLMGGSGAFEWAGSEFWIHGESEFAVSVASSAGPGLLEDLINSLSVEQRDCLSGTGHRPSVRDASELFESHPAHRRLLAPAFWQHFLEELPRWGRRAADTVRWMPEGGIIDQPFSGLVLAQGNLQLQESCLITGLVLHLGAGEVTLQDEAQIRGGLWLCDAASSPDPSSAGPLRLRLRDRACIVYDRAAIRYALKSFPPTQLGWRILFPEMSG
jgi:hypothetical protein